MQGVFSQLQIWLKVSNLMLFMDTINFKTYAIDSSVFWKNIWNITIVANKSNLKKFVIINIDKKFESLDKSKSKL